MQRDRSANLSSCHATLASLIVVVIFLLRRVNFKKIFATSCFTGQHSGVGLNCVTLVLVEAASLRVVFLWCPRVLHTPLEPVMGAITKGTA